MKKCIFLFFLSKIIFFSIKIRRSAVMPNAMIEIENLGFMFPLFLTCFFFTHILLHYITIFFPGVTWLKLRNARRNSSSSEPLTETQESDVKRQRSFNTLPVSSSSASGLAGSSKPDVVVQSHILRRRPLTNSASSSSSTLTRSISTRKAKSNGGNNGSNNPTPSIQMMQ